MTRFYALAWKASEHIFLMAARECRSIPGRGLARGGKIYALPIRKTTSLEAYPVRTPTHADWKNMGCSSQLYLTDQVRPQQVTNKSKLQNRELHNLRMWKDGTTGHGKLNPTWVEWLMGFPLQWSKRRTNAD